MNMELLQEGGVVMLIGVSVVFSFLLLTVFAMQIMSKIVCYLNKIFPEATVEINNQSKKTDSSAFNAEIAVAIAAVMAKK